jgi:signal transduction histidine kinase
LRAPLRSINGFSQALLEDYGAQLDAAALGYLQRVRGASQHTAVLIDDLLELARVTRSELRRERVDLSTLAKEITADLRKTDPERAAEIIITPGLSAVGDARLRR